MSAANKQNLINHRQRVMLTSSALLYAVLYNQAYHAQHKLCPPSARVIYGQHRDVGR